ncbi:host-nuclease inhibitor Gam family protein [Tepidibacillus marianensis]|uniref:host-nuclease inhibitor Gam family protein n=1 Tax=Tepidibacillus marianensis TaxID=3131995 RepID=UPI00338F60B6
MGGVKATTDDEKLVKWLKDNGYTDFVKVEEKPIWIEFKKKLNLEPGLVTIAETGEIVEGITVAQQPDSFIVD